MIDSLTISGKQLPHWYPGQLTVWILFLFLLIILSGSLVNCKLRQIIEYEDIEEYLLLFIHFLFFLYLIYFDTDIHDEHFNKGILDYPDFLAGHLSSRFYTSTSSIAYWKVICAAAVVFEISAVIFYFIQPYSYFLVVIGYFVGVCCGMPLYYYNYFYIHICSGFCLLGGAIVEAIRGIILLHRRRML